VTAPLLEIPTSACASSVVMMLSRTVGISTSPYTYEEQFFKWPGERWSADVRMPPLKEPDSDEWIAFLLKLEGTYGRFLMGDPSRRTPRGEGGGTPQVDGGGQTGNSINVKNAGSGVWLKAGDYFQLGTGASARLYKLTADAEPNSSGDVTLQFVPSLRSSPADSAAVTIENPRGLFRLVENDVSWGVEPGRIYRIGFRAVEAL
jgi:hypothetical protein